MECMSRPLNSFPPLCYAKHCYFGGTDRNLGSLGWGAWHYSRGVHKYHEVEDEFYRSRHVWNNSYCGYEEGWYVCVRCTNWLIIHTGCSNSPLAMAFRSISRASLP
jgi:hypothetical protein